MLICISLNEDAASYLASLEAMIYRVFNDRLKYQFKNTLIHTFLCNAYIYGKTVVVAYILYGYVISYVIDLIS